MASITIVVPTYDRLAYLALALQSIADQTSGDYTVVVYDDNGNTGNAALVAAMNDPRFRYVRREKNLGTLRNTLGAIADVETTYFATLNDDDIWHPDFLKTLVGALEANPTASVAFCDHWLIDAEGNVDTAGTAENSRGYGRDVLARGLHQPFLYNGCLLRTIPGAMGSVFRTAAIDLSERPSIDTFYDEWLTYLATRDSQAVYYEPERYSYYRLHAGMTTVLSMSGLENRLWWRYAAEYLSNLKAKDTRLAAYRDAFVRRNRIELIRLCVLATAAGKRDGVAARLASARTVQPAWLIAALGLMTRLPSPVVRAPIALSGRLG